MSGMCLHVQVCVLSNDEGEVFVGLINVLGMCICEIFMIGM